MLAHSRRLSSRRSSRTPGTVVFRFSIEANRMWCGPGATVHALHQALLNIIVNAIEATPAGGEVRVAASVSEGACRLRISDTGPGIPEPVKKKIFQLYFTTKSGGSGIGLAVAYRSLQLHGGDIKVETKLGEGTSFELIIPALQKEAVAIA